MYIHEGARPGGEPHTMNVGRGRVQKYESSLLHQAFIEHECDWAMGTITVASEDAAAAVATIGGLQMEQSGGDALEQSQKRNLGFMNNFGTYIVVVLGLIAAPFIPAMIPIAIGGAVVVAIMHALDNAVIRWGVRRADATGDAWAGKRRQDAVSWAVVVVLFLVIVLMGGVFSEWRLGMEPTIGVWP